MKELQYCAVKTSRKRQDIIVKSEKRWVIKMTHFIIRHEDGTTTYRNIEFEQHNSRYMIRSNIDLLDLGLCTPKTIQRGHRGYTSLATLMKRINKGLGD